MLLAGFTSSTPRDANPLLSSTAGLCCTHGRADGCAVLPPEGDSITPSPSHPLYVFICISLVCICILELLSDSGACVSFPVRPGESSECCRSCSFPLDVLALDGLCFFHLLRQRTRKAGYLALLSKSILQAVCRIEADFPGCEVCKANHHATDKNIIVLMCFTNARKWSKSSRVI